MCGETAKFYGIDRLWSRYKDRPPQTKLKGLLIASFIASATHPLLDWTNNYGIRWFLPWSQKWSYGDFVFIVDAFVDFCTEPAAIAR